MRTLKCAYLVISFFITFIFSIIFMEWFVIIFILPLLFILFAGIINFYDNDIDIEVVRTLSNVKIFEDDKIIVTLSLKNLGENISFLEIFDRLPAKVQVTKGSNYNVINLKRGEVFDYSFEISCPFRGRFKLGPLFFRIRDFFGLFYKEAVVDTESFITVIPQIEEIRDIDIKSKANIYPGIMQTKHSGIGSEFYGIRDYCPGDTFKKINWKTFARFNKPMVNEFELESTTDVIVIIDSRGNQGVGTIKHNPLEYSIRAAAAITSYFLRRRDRVGLIAYGRSDGHLQWIYPESGKKQLYKIIEEIVSLEPFGDFPLNGVVSEAIMHMIPQKALIIFISSVEGDWTIIRATEDLVMKGFNVIILSPSHIDIEYSLHSVDTNFNLAHKILAFDRNNYLIKLKNTGAKVIDWNPTLPLAVSLKEVERFKTRR